MFVKHEEVFFTFTSKTNFLENSQFDYKINPLSVLINKKTILGFFYVLNFIDETISKIRVN